MEIIVAVSVIALLAGVLTPMIGNVVEESKRARAAEDCKAIAEAIGAYRVDAGGYPPGQQGDPTYNYGNPAYFGYGVEVLNPTLMEGAKKYLSKAIAKDPWGNAYSYHIYTRSDPYMDVAVFSHGPNKNCESWDGNLWNKGKFGGDDIGAFFDVAK